MMPQIRLFGEVLRERIVAFRRNDITDYVQQQGSPRALYVDQHGIYRSDREASVQEVLAGKEPRHNGRALAELGVELILERNPQAKGRVERINGTLQGRLVKALRRSQIDDVEQANAFLEATFLPKLDTQLESPHAFTGECASAAPPCAISAVSSRFSKQKTCRTIGRYIRKMASLNWKSLRTATAASKTCHRL